MSALLLAIALAGCGPSSPVVLLTAEQNGNGCYLSGITGDLVTDQTYGTAVLEAVRTQTGSKVSSWPVKWPSGFTGRQSGSQVEVLDGSGHVVAQTGTRVHILGGYEGDHPRAWLDAISPTWTVGTAL